MSWREIGNGVRVDKNRRMVSRQEVYVFEQETRQRNMKKVGKGKWPKAMTSRYRIWMMNMRRPIRPFIRFPETKGDE